MSPTMVDTIVRAVYVDSRGHSLFGGTGWIITRERQGCIEERCVRTSARRARRAIRDLQGGNPCVPVIQEENGRPDVRIDRLRLDA